MESIQLEEYYLPFFSCRNNEILKYESVCNEYRDCFDGSDEGDICHCNSTDLINCVGTFGCIFKNNVCDGKVNCANGYDELDCASEGEHCPGFRCQNGLCLGSIQMICDGVNNCGDNSDEDTCSNSRSYVVLTENSRPKLYSFTYLHYMYSVSNNVYNQRTIGEALKWNGM